MKKIRYMLEAALLGLAFFIFKMMPAEMASACGGWVGRTVGPHLAASRKALKHVSQSFPDKSEEERHAIVHDMWDNLGRVMAEYPHLGELVMKAEIVGEEHLKSLPPSYVIIGGHVANWEVMPFYFNHRINLPVTAIYREPNNPYVARLLERARDPGEQGLYTPKSTKGSRDILKAMHDGGRIVLLFDQKYNQGIASDFFGHPAMTSPSFAQIARKYSCPIVPVWVERLKGASFRIVIDTPIDAAGNDEDVLATAHRRLETHIRKNPAQWLWLHRRWIT